MFRAQSKHVIKLSVNDNVHLKYQKGFTLKIEWSLDGNLRPNFDIYIFVLLQIEFNVDKKKK